MKKFIIKLIIIVFIPVCLLFMFSEFSLRQIPNDYKYKKEWLDKNSNSLKILNLGSSHAFYGIQPQYFKQKAFNAAYVSQSIKYDELIFNKYFDSMDSLEYLILPISYFSLFSELENGAEAWRTRKYNIYFGFNSDITDLKNNFEIYDINDKVWNRVIKSLLKKENQIICTNLGNGVLDTQHSTAEKLEETGDEAAKRHTHKLNKDTIDKNTKRIEIIITKCVKRNIKVILLSTPTYKTYYTRLNKSQLCKMQEICTQITVKQKNTVYLNLLRDNRFIEDDFFDADHLNQYGSRKLTLILNEYIN